MSVFLRRQVLRLYDLATKRRLVERLEELNRTQWLKRDDLIKLQRDKLQRLVEYAYQYVPYYRRTFEEAGFHPGDLRRDPAALSKLPIMTKQTVRENFDDLLTTEPERRQSMSKKSTSGSTGHPLIFMQDTDFRDYVTAGIQRHIGWAGWKLGQRQAVIWGASFDINFKQRLRTQIFDWVWNRFQTNAFVLTDDSLAVFTEKVRRERPRILFGYASGAHRFAQYIRQNSYGDITFGGVFTTAEALLPAVRQYVEETLHCKVFNRYATLELGDVACECEAHTGLHVSMENNYVEILCNGRPAQSGEIADVVVTNLNNLGMPFIRYSVGDASGWYQGEDCPCGRAAPLLQAVQGRLVDSFQTRDGRTAWAGFAGAGYTNLAHPSVKQFQIVQKSLDLMVVRLVTEGEVPQPNLAALTRTIQTAFGENVVVKFEFLDEIPTLASGKYQYAVSELNKA